MVASNDKDFDLHLRDITGLVTYDGGDSWFYLLGVVCHLTKAYKYQNRSKT
ncbi:protein of unknown function [Paenibacillus alvei]|uniref:Uncharacterized protein n=1 Tax=Paenibacillus alvei TaxID=44250 RepID=A0A383R6D5_PAEAL|nr:protein of unknown function [Paenibacillus alvei]